MGIHLWGAREREKQIDRAELGEQSCPGIVNCFVDRLRGGQSRRKSTLLRKGHSQHDTESPASNGLSVERRRHNLEEFVDTRKPNEPTRRVVETEGLAESGRIILDLGRVTGGSSVDSGCGDVVSLVVDDGPSTGFPEREVDDSETSAAIGVDPGHRDFA